MSSDPFVELGRTPSFPTEKHEQSTYSMDVASRIPSVPRVTSLARARLAVALPVFGNAFSENRRGKAVPRVRREAIAASLGDEARAFGQVSLELE